MLGPVSFCGSLSRRDDTVQVHAFLAGSYEKRHDVLTGSDEGCSLQGCVFVTINEPDLRMHDSSGSGVQGY